jgi:transposase
MRDSRSAFELGFSHYDKVRLQKAMQTVRDKRTFLRLKSVWLFAGGMKITQIAWIAAKSRQIIYRWINAYLTTHQPDALKDEHRTGRPASAACITDKRIMTELKRNPMKLGYASNVWTVALLAQHLSRRYHCDIHVDTLRRRMKQTGLRCKRPRYVYAEKDPNRAQKKGRLSES